MGGILVMQFYTEENLDISIVMPCLNEVNTVAICVEEALKYIEKNGLKGEVVVADNGSTDGSGNIAKQSGAEVVHVSEIGYGNAIRKGIAYACGRVIIIGDCDTTYDFSKLEDFYESLSSGKYDVMIGDRFAGGIDKGAMPLSHKYGVRFLSMCGRRRFNTDVRDFHCGLRGITRIAAKKLEFSCEGMEFATEIIACAAKNELAIGQTPVKLRKCVYERKSKLKTIRDGMRHLLYIIHNGDCEKQTKKSK